ncbi:MAG TPA: DUF4159 domain-containing protein [Longimicrobiales bacterium]|nr:DUF4159 domain-containing protein [Longimicrobiales bacterium]
MRRRLIATAVVCAALGTAALGYGQRFGRGYSDVPYCYAPDECPRTAYDGRFTFVRMYFDTRPNPCTRGGGGEPPWHHDRPEAERNLSSILREISRLNTFDGITGGNVLGLDDPEIFQYPVLWVSEPGFWIPTDEQVKSLRAYLAKGGFIIFDDFTGCDMSNLAAQMFRVLPELQPLELTGAEPIWRSFFDVNPAELRLSQGRMRATYWGLFEGNDPTKRQLAMMNVDNDIGEYMEYSATGFRPVDETNEAYKLAVNYIVYALTH